MAFGPSASTVEEILESLFVAVAHGNIGFSKHDAATVDDADFVLLHDVGAVYPHKARGGELLLHGLHAHQ